MDNLKISSQITKEEDELIKINRKYGRISSGQLRPPSKKKTKKITENSDCLTWNLEITDEDKIEQLNALIVGAAKSKYYSSEEQYKRALKEFEKSKLIKDEDLGYFNNPIAFFNIFCNELCFTYIDISWDLVQRFNININTPLEEKVYDRLISCLKNYIKDTNTYADEHSGYELILYYYCSLNKIQDHNYLLNLFKAHFFYYNNMPVFYYNNTLCVVSEKTIYLFLKHFKFGYNSSNLNTSLSNTLYYQQKNPSLFHYSSNKDSRIYYHNQSNNQIYIYKFNQNNKRFELADKNIYNEPTIKLNFTQRWNEKQYKNYIYLLTQGSREIFDNIAKLLASLFLTGSYKNKIHIILVNEQYKKKITCILESLSDIIQPDEDMSTFLRRSIGQYTVQQYKHKRAFLVRSLEEHLNNLQIDKLKKMLNAKRMTQKIVINGKKRKLLFTNSLDIIGITSNSSIAKTYESFQANIIDLTSIKDLESPFSIPGFCNWCRLPWTLYGISLIESIECVPKPIKSDYFANQYFNEFVEKYITIKDIVNTKESKKNARENRNFTYKNDLFNYYNRLFSSMYPEISLDEKQNSLTKRLCERFPGLIEDRPHTSSSSSNSRAFLGLTLNSQAIEEDIKNFSNNEHNNEKIKYSLYSSDSEFIELMQTCESLIPDDLEKIVCNKNQLKVTIT